MGRNLFAEYKAPVPPAAVARAAEPTFDLGQVGVFHHYRPWHGRRVNRVATSTAAPTKPQGSLSATNSKSLAIKGKVQRIDFDAPHVELLIDGKTVIFSQYKSLGDTLADRQKMQK